MIVCDFCGNDTECTGDSIPLCHRCYEWFADPDSKYYQPRFVQPEFHGIVEAIL